MIIFLDTVTNVAAAPNENYARELLELYSMGVDGGYTQTDVEQLARVFTGWSLCKKHPAEPRRPARAVHRELLGARAGRRVRRQLHRRTPRLRRRRRCSPARRSR